MAQSGHSAFNHECRLLMLWTAPPSARECHEMPAKRSQRLMVTGSNGSSCSARGHAGTTAPTPITMSRCSSRAWAGSGTNSASCQRSRPISSLMPTRRKGSTSLIASGVQFYLATQSLSFGESLASRSVPRGEATFVALPRSTQTLPAKGSSMLTRVFRSKEAIGIGRIG